MMRSPVPRRLRPLALLSALLILITYSFLRTTIPPEADGRVHLTNRKQDYPVESLIPLPTAKSPKNNLPPIQARPRPETAAQKSLRLERQAAVREAFLHSWTGYKNNAWLHDEVRPVAGGYKDKFGGWAATLVDSLDSLYILDLHEEFELAVNAIKKIDFSTTDQVVINVFETIIRYLGGFLGAYDVSGGRYPVLLEKAVEVGELVMGAFDTPNRMPISRWNWDSYAKGNRQRAVTEMIVSELGSLSIEFTRLSQLTGDMKYYDAIQRVSDVFEEHQNQTQLPGMWPVIVDAQTPQMLASNEFHLGGMIDSLYEYLPKQYLLLGGHLEQPKKMYEKFLEVAKEHIFFRPMNPENQKLVVPGEIRIQSNKEQVLSPRLQHLGCFAGGMLAMASKIFDKPEDLEVGRQITDACIWTYSSTTTGISPEILSLTPCKSASESSPSTIVSSSSDEQCTWSEPLWHDLIRQQNYFQDDAHGTWQAKVADEIKYKRLSPSFVRIDDPRYILRPEAIESVFYMYRITGDRSWQYHAWTMFQAIVNATRTEIAFSEIEDVTDGGGVEGTRKADGMESFWMAETLKYFFLIFSDMDLVSLDEYVLNTEAHPFRLSH